MKKLILIPTLAIASSLPALCAVSCGIKTINIDNTKPESLEGVVYSDPFDAKEGQSFKIRMNTSHFKSEKFDFFALGICKYPVESKETLSLEVNEKSSSILVNGESILHTEDELEDSHYWFQYSLSKKVIYLDLKDVKFDEDIVLNLTFTKSFKDIVFICECISI